MSVRLHVVLHTALAGLAMAVPGRAAQAQELSAGERQRVLEAARARYYSLTGQGLRSFTCRVRFDLQTISPVLLPTEDRADRTLLDSATFAVKVTQDGAALAYAFPEGSVSQDPNVVAGVTGWISALVRGFFAVWPAKGLDGPLPRKDKQVVSISRVDGGGYALGLKGPDGAEELRLDSAYKAVRLSSRNGSLQERPTYTPAAGGLVFTGNESEDREPGGTLHVRYAVDLNKVDGLLLPGHVHLQVGDRTDVRFALEGCRTDLRH